MSELWVICYKDGQNTMFKGQAVRKNSARDKACVYVDFESARRALKYFSKTGHALIIVRFTPDREME